MTRTKGKLKMIGEVELWELALAGLRRRREEVSRRIDELRARVTRAVSPGPARRHRLTPEGRRRLVAALKRRWAERKKAKK